jgi:hypothetical protein
MAKLNPSNNPNRASTADLTVPLSLSASDFFLLDAKPMRHANSERPTSKISRLANTIHWLEKNRPNI